jgi:hypothetical protein
MFRAYSNPLEGASDMLRWLNRHGCLTAADANDLDGYIAGLKSGGYLGNGDYNAYKSGMQGFISKLGGVTPSTLEPAAASRFLSKFVIGASLAGGGWVLYRVATDRPLMPHLQQNPIHKKTDYYIAGGAIAASAPTPSTCSVYSLYTGPVAPGSPVGDAATRILAAYYAGTYKMGDVVFQSFPNIGTIRFLVTMHGPNPQNPQDHPGVSAFLCA